MNISKPRPVTSYGQPANREFQPRENSSWPLGLLRVGKDHGYYEEDLIGEGLSSKVYRGHNVHTRTKPSYSEQIVSVKVIKKQQMRQNNIAALLYNEVKILKKLQHESVVGLIHFEENERQLSIITEYCNGGDLEQLIAKKKKLPEYLALSILEDIIRGYGHLVANGIIHRDIKPANIFLSNGRAKLADFGFAMTKNDVFSKEQAVGSPIYMPPETLQHLEYSHKSDIFAIGVVFFQMLHGCVPWEASTQKELLYRMSKKACTINEELHLSDKSKAFLEASLERKVDARMDEKDLVSFFRRERSKLLPYQKKERQAINASFTPRPEKIDSGFQVSAQGADNKFVSNQNPELPIRGPRKRADSYCETDVKTEVKRNNPIQRLIEPAKTSKFRPSINGWLK